MKISLAVILTLLPGPSFSQGQLLQAVAGTTLARATGGSGYENLSGNILAGYNLGLTADFPLKKGGDCSFRSGLMLNQWGGRFPETTGSTTQSLRITYIRTPVLLARRFGLSLLTDLLLGAGSYVGWRINTPSEIYTIARVGNHSSGSLYPNDGTRNNYYNRVDYGLSFHCSVEMRNRFNICLQYDHGLQNMLRNGNGASLHNRAVTLSLGYYLNLTSFLHKQFPY